MMKISENYIVGVDISYNKEASIVQVVKSVRDGLVPQLEVVKTFIGKEAEDFFEKMTGTKLIKLESKEDK